jgi:hypothetical protein
MSFWFEPRRSGYCWVGVEHPGGCWSSRSGLRPRSRQGSLRARLRSIVERSHVAGLLQSPHEVSMLGGAQPLLYGGENRVNVAT